MAPALGWPRLLVNRGERNESEAVCWVTPRLGHSPVATIPVRENLSFLTEMWSNWSEVAAFMSLSIWHRLAHQVRRSTLRIVL